MDAKQNDLSYFSLRLQELLSFSFPEKASDQKLIEERSLFAANAYQSAYNSVNSIEQCSETANFILFENLHFSRFDTAFQVVCQEFDTNVFGLVRVTQAFIGLLQKSTEPRIVNVSTSVGSLSLQSDPNWPAYDYAKYAFYGSSKAAMNIYTVSLRTAQYSF